MSSDGDIGAICEERERRQARAVEYLVAYNTLTTIRPAFDDEKAAAHNARRLLANAPLFIPEFLR